MSAELNCALMDDEPPDAIPLESAADESNSGVKPESQVPITIITGFLGAGKTTLVNHILTQPHGFKIAVVLNDFGDNLGIERALVTDGSSASEASSIARARQEPIVEEWVEVGNGCICCSVKHSFVLALEQLLERRDRFDYILLETTGLANPGPVISMLWTDAELESPLRLDSVVTVVDGHNILRQLKEDLEGSGTKLAQIQIAFADTVIVNKMDLISCIPSQLAEIMSHIRAINGSAQVIKSERSAVDVGLLLNQQRFSGKDVDRYSAPLASKEAEDLSLQLGLEIKTVHFSMEGEVDLTKLEAWLTDLLWEPVGPMNILRMKGAVCIPGSTSLKIFQAVKELFEFLDGQPGSRTTSSVNNVLVVGAHLDEESLRKGFSNCLV